MKTNILTLVVTLTLGIILCGSLLMPVITDAQDDLTVTKTNDYGIFAKVADEDLTMSASLSNSVWSWTVNDTTVEYPVDNTVGRPILVTDTINVMIDGSAIIVSAPSSRYTGQTSFTATLEDGTLTANFTNGSTPRELVSEPAWAFYSSDSGNYRSFYLTSSSTLPNATVYYTDLNEIYGSSFLITTSKFFSFKGNEVTYYTSSSTTETITAEVTPDNVSGTQTMKSLYVSRTAGDYAFTVDNSGNDYTAHPWMFIVPYSVTSDAVANPEAMSALYGAIPILFIIGLVLAATGALYMRRND